MSGRRRGVGKGRPSPAQFRSAPFSRAKDTYNLTWIVESYPPLEEVRLLYRKIMPKWGMPFLKEVLTRSRHVTSLKTFITAILNPYLRYQDLLSSYISIPEDLVCRPS
ncbi:unnamed protein product [Nezara viridula]|uniref:Uncharacterized protein n=1 Tax=Nezara viridula TaxID=85310 RepID=A0A9P0H7U4_NEZVI|nr:unnamed protein product [Nezara viridula]